MNWGDSGAGYPQRVNRGAQAVFQRSGIRFGLKDREPLTKCSEPALRS